MSTGNNWLQVRYGKAGSGYTFESICMKHLPQLKKALGIASVYTEYSSFISRGKLSAKGAQIDLLIDRNDQGYQPVRNEIHRSTLYHYQTICSSVARKKAVFINETGTKKAVFPTFITSFGVVTNEHSIGLVQQHVLLDDLFHPV